MTRTFIALELNEALQGFLSEIISRISQELPDIRWVNARGIHLTLAFLGELSDDRLVEAILATEEAAKKAIPFQYCLKGLGIFGSSRQPRVIWMGVEDMPSGKLQGSPLQYVYGVLAKELEMRGFEVDKRSFSPHLTLARIKQPLSLEAQQRLQRLLHAKVAGLSSAMYPVNALCVMKSELSRTGAHYTCLREAKFR
jgi:RNA 2',3'-cyclic 3'-phosphodiesterase